MRPHFRLMTFSKINFSFKILAVLALLFCAVNGAVAQDEKTGTLDKILVVMGRNKIILQSELDAQFIQMKLQDPSLDDSMKCNLLQQMIIQKLLVEQAERDSLPITEEEIDATIDNKIRYYTRQLGSKEKLEEMLGKTVYQIKEDNHDVVKEQKLAEKMQSKILDNVKITPAEVQVFYNKLPVDSLPFYPATVEIGQIVMDPPVSPELDAYAKEELEKIRKRVVDSGESFEVLAGIYSQDPGSRDNGGAYNDVTRSGGWAPEFIAAAFKLQNGEVSPVIKTQFGYHIIQMVARKGEVCNLRHILIRPQQTSADFKIATHKLDSVRNLLLAGKFSFPEAVGKFSTDESAKSTGGMIADPTTGAAQLEMDKLDPAMVLTLDTLSTGSYSRPQTFTTEKGDQSVRVVYLRNRTSPHKANLKDDYSKIQQVALSQKQAMKLEKWVSDRLPNYYLRITKDYSTCPAFANWKIAQK